MLKTDRKHGRSASNTVFVRMASLLGTTALAIGLSGCGEAIYDSIELMPPPAVYAEGEVDPFPRVTENNLEEQGKLFYVTDRSPVTAEDKPAYYANRRGFALRGGIVRVRVDPPFSGWEEIKAVSLSEEESPKRLLLIDTVEEYGPLPVNEISILPDQPEKAQKQRSGAEFARAVNRKLASSVQKDIFIYVHGYNVDFDYSVLSSKELQHYLGYRGAFITYAWPATPNRFAYFKDIETTSSTRKNLREFIDFLSNNTSAEKIHIIGYSAGSRLAFEAVYDLTLKYSLNPSRAPRLGQLILIGSELDRSYFGQALDDGVLEATDWISIYMSTSDAALRMSSLVLGEDRLGQVSIADTDESRAINAKIREIPNLSLIDVSAAEGSNLGNGHSYFRSSPWASSDMFASLIWGLTPEERGLERDEGEAAWQFPSDYPDRIVNAVAKQGK